jgi:prevent-host-death family protein
MSAKRPRPVSIVEAKARFSELVREAEAGFTVVIRRHGRDVAAVVPAGDAEQLRLLRAAGPAAGLASVAGGWQGSEGLVERLGAFKRSPPRRRVRLGD